MFSRICDAGLRSQFMRKIATNRLRGKEVKHVGRASDGTLRTFQAPTSATGRLLSAQQPVLTRPTLLPRLSLRTAPHLLTAAALRPSLPSHPQGLGLLPLPLPHQTGTCLRAFAYAAPPPTRNTSLADALRACSPVHLHP